MRNALVVWQACTRRQWVPHRMYVSSALPTRMRRRQVTITLTVPAMLATRGRMGPCAMLASPGNTRIFRVLCLVRTVRWIMKEGNRLRKQAARLRHLVLSSVKPVNSGRTADHARYVRKGRTKQVLGPNNALRVLQIQFHGLEVRTLPAALATLGTQAPMVGPAQPVSLANTRSW